MLRNILGVIAGFVVWFAIVYTGGYVLRASWPAYLAADPAMVFTLPMMFARLALGIVATLAAARLAVVIANHRDHAALALGIVLVLFFIPVHIGLWDKFPLWYHLFFLLM